MPASGAHYLNSVSAPRVQEMQMFYFEYSNGKELNMTDVYRLPSKAFISKILVSVQCTQLIGCSAHWTPFQCWSQNAQPKETLHQLQYDLMQMTDVNLAE
jgi:hypothetical protein